MLDTLVGICDDSEQLFSHIHKKEEIRPEKERGRHKDKSGQ